MWTRRHTVILMMAAIAAPAMAASRFDSPEHDFSVAFPADPVIEGRRAANDDDSSYAIYDLQDNGVAYTVRMDRFPTSLPPPAPDMRTYTLMLRSHARESASRLVSTAPARLGGRDAVEGIFVRDDGARQQMRVLLIGRRVYQVSYTGPDGAESAATGAAFLDSFRIAER